jgi:hypothetical protein
VNWKIKFQPILEFKKLELKISLYETICKSKFRISVFEGKKTGI